MLVAISNYFSSQVIKDVIFYQGCLGAYMQLVHKGIVLYFLVNMVLNNDLFKMKHSSRVQLYLE